MARQTNEGVRDWVKKSPTRFAQSIRTFTFKTIFKPNTLSVTDNSREVTEM